MDENREELYKKMLEDGNLKKYISDDMKVINGIFKDGKIRFTQPFELNDPLEFNPDIVYNSETNEEVKYNLDKMEIPSIRMLDQIFILNLIASKYGVLSLTKNPSSFLMWSHYTNKHRGMVIEFEEGFEKQFKNKDQVSYEVKKVEYSKEHYTVNFEDLLVDGSLHEKILCDNLFFRKMQRWKYEKEYRIIRSLNDDVSYVKKEMNLDEIFYDDSIYLFPINSLQLNQ